MTAPARKYPTPTQALDAQREAAHETAHEGHAQFANYYRTVAENGIRDAARLARGFRQNWPTQRDPLAEFREHWPQPMAPTPVRPMGATPSDPMDDILEEFDLQRFLREARANAPECSTTPSDAGMRALVFYLAKTLYELQRRIVISERAVETLNSKTQALVAVRTDLLALVAENDTLPACGDED